MEFLPELLPYIETRGPTAAFSDGVFIDNPIIDGRAHHEIYLPPRRCDIKFFEEKLVIPIPFEVLRLFMFMNGGYLFYGHLALHGFRENFLREGNDVHQPYDIYLYNQYGRQEKLFKTEFVFGSYGPEDSLLSICDGVIYKRSKEGLFIIRQWNDINAMLTSEFRRLDEIAAKSR